MEALHSNIYKLEKIENEFGSLDRFVTSGLGSVFPMGLAVGEVRALYPDSYGRGLIAEIAPLADFTDLSRVMVITGFQSDAKNLTDGTASDSSETKHSETEAAE